MHTTDKCRIAYVSERTLQYAFKERCVIPPNVFIKRWKLNTIKKMLFNADPNERTIGEIIEYMGFHHQSQFTADYRKLFAELPSWTLIKNKCNYSA